MPLPKLSGYERRRLYFQKLYTCLLYTSGEACIPGKSIGHVDIYDDYTFVDVPAEYAKDIIVAMKNNKIKGKKVNIEIAKKK